MPDGSSGSECCTSARAGPTASPRIHAELQEEGEKVARKRVARLMRSAGLVGISRRKGFKTTARDRDARPAPDLVERVFHGGAARPALGRGHHLHPDLDRLSLPGRRLDVCSRRIVGWAMATHLRTELVLEALNMAIASADRGT